MSKVEVVHSNTNLHWNQTRIVTYPRGIQSLTELEALDSDRGLAPLITIVDRTSKETRFFAGAQYLSGRAHPFEWYYAKDRGESSWKVARLEWIALAVAESTIENAFADTYVFENLSKLPEPDDARIINSWETSRQFYRSPAELQMEAQLIATSAIKERAKLLAELSCFLESKLAWRVDIEVGFHDGHNELFQCRPVIDRGLHTCTEYPSDEVTPIFSSQIVTTKCNREVHLYGEAHSGAATINEEGLEGWAKIVNPEKSGMLSPSPYPFTFLAMGVLGLSGCTRTIEKLFLKPSEMQ